MKINCEISGLGLHGRRCRFSKLSEWGKPSSVLDEELVACSQATLKQRRLPREDWRIQEPRNRDKASVYLCFRPRPPPQYKPPGVVSTLRHSAWFYGSPNSHKEQTWHDIWHRHDKLLTPCSGNIVWWLYEAVYELKRYINKYSFCMLNNWSCRAFIIKIKTLKSLRGIFLF